MEEETRKVIQLVEEVGATKRALKEITAIRSCFQYINRRESEHDSIVVKPVSRKID